MMETRKERENDLQEQVRELLQTQKLIEKQLREVKNGIQSSLNNIKSMPGVIKTRKLVRTVKFSTIVENGLILSPEYYFSDSCTEHIMNQMKEVGSVDELFKLIRKMSKEEKVMDKRTSYRLNPNIIEVLKSIVPEG